MSNNGFQGAIFLRRLIFLACLFVGSCAYSQEGDDLLDWSVDFESGNAAGLHLRDDGAVGFTIESEPGGEEYLWFYFSIVSHDQEKLEFVLENAAGAHQTGERWKITKPWFSADGQTWVRSAQAQYGREPSLSGLLKPPVFRFRSPIVADTLRVAYFQPYTNADLRNYLKGIEGLPGVVCSALGRTEEGRNIAQVLIGGSVEIGAEDRQQIWIICREHPGETPASFVCEGLMNALISHPAGRRLRDAYDFVIIPLLNSDGTAHGFYYHNANAVNLARDWVEFRSSEVRSLRDALAGPIHDGRVRMIVNLHASNDPTKGHFFLVIPDEKLRTADAELQRSILRAGDRNHPQLQGRSPVNLLDLPGISGNALCREYGVYNFYVEANYSRGADGSSVTPQSLRQVGVALVQTLAEVLRPE